MLLEDVENKLIGIIEPSPKLAREIATALDSKQIETIIKFACKRSKSRERRRKIIKGCLLRELRKQELERWLHRHADPYDILSPEEIQQEDREELRAYCRLREEKENELSVLHGNGGGYFILQQRVGDKEASRLWQKLCAAYDASIQHQHRRVTNIIMAACKPHIRYPAIYIERTLQQVKDGRRKSRA